MTMNFSGISAILVLAFWTLTSLIHVTFAVAINQDISELEAQSRKIELVNPLVWILATLVGGMITVGVYWLVHHIKRREDGR